MNNLNTPIAHPSGKYIRQAKLTLQNYFPRVSCAAVDAVLHSTRYSFKDSFYFLSNIESQRSVIDGNGSGHFGMFPSHIKVFIKYKRPKKIITLADRDEQLSNEIDSIPEFINTKEKVPIDPPAGEGKVDFDDAAKAQVAEMECLCCYADCPLSELMECKSGSGHLVCKQCINNYVSEQLDGNGSVAFRCIVDSDCEHKYSNEILDQDGVLSPKLKERVNDRVFREMVKSAGIGDEW